MRTTFPYEQTWQNVEKSWNGDITLNTTPFRASYTPEYGCLSIGVPPDGAFDKIPLLTARVLLVVSKVASGSKVCTDLHATLLDQVKNGLGFPVDLSCDDIQEHALMNTSWRKDAVCGARRLEWPELVGANLDIVVRYFEMYHPDKLIEVFPWDSLNARPAARDVVRIVYETRSRKVVNPAPHVGIANIPALEDQCFTHADPNSSARCMGAPRLPPDTWTQLVGKLVTDAVDTLRFTYPHATIEATPSVASVASDKRQDRIRVWFDPATARVDRVPTIG